MSVFAHIHFDVMAGGVSGGVWGPQGAHCQTARAWLQRQVAWGSGGDTLGIPVQLISVGCWLSLLLL